MEAGLQIGPNIRLERMLSQGGMGSVWVAEHLTLGTQVAVKFITRDLADDPQMLMRFQREATAAAQIKSPHVVQVFDHGLTPEGQPYIVMELLHGEDLDVRIERLGRMSLWETALVVRQAGKALGVAHRLGIVHRDIKPANLFLVDLDGDPYLKVLDFGIAKRRSETGTVSGVTNTGAMVGTPHFMSPEQVASSRDATASSDLWALAVVAYNCLLGRRPFEGETVGGLCIAIHTARFLLPSMVDPSLPEGLDAWFLRALSRDPKARFQTAKELTEAFMAAVPGNRLSERPQPISGEPARERTSTAPTLAQPSAAPMRSAPQTLGGAAVRTDPGKRRSRALLGVGALVVVLGAAVVWMAIPHGASVGSAPGEPAASSPRAIAEPASALPVPAAPSESATALAPEPSPATGAAPPIPATTSAVASGPSPAAGVASGPAGVAVAAGRTAPRASHAASATAAAPAPASASVHPSTGTTPLTAPKDRGF